MGYEKKLGQLENQPFPVLNYIIKSVRLKNFTRAKQTDKQPKSENSRFEKQTNTI